MGRDSLTGSYSITSVQYQTAIAALNRLLDEGNPFVLSVQISAPVRRRERRSRASDVDSLCADTYTIRFLLLSCLDVDSLFVRANVIRFLLLLCRVRPQHPPYISAGEYMNPYYNKRDQLFVSPSISDSMKSSAYYSSKRDKAYQNRDNIAELVGEFLFHSDERRL
jgi:hypothetical protein